MSILNVTNLSHGFGARVILEDASFRLLQGEHVGVVGTNGAGKSTFMNIITGKLMPDAGVIEWASKVTKGYLDQYSTLEKGNSIRDVLKSAFAHMFELEQKTFALYEKMGDCTPEEMDVLLEEIGEIQSILENGNFYNLDSKIEEYAAGLGILEIGLEKDVAELSGGQRAKILLAKVLLENHNVLILDEPTNFLDEDHITWLTNFLKSYENSFILVSHDLPFMKAVTNVIYHIDQTELTRYSGGYDQFMSMYDLKKKQTEAAFKKQQKEIDALEKFVAKNKARASTSNMAKSRQKKLDKMDVIEISKEKPKPKFRFNISRSPSREIVEVKDLVLGYDTPLTKPLNFSIERNQKIAIKGVNGLGKSTLLNTILGVIKPISGELEHGQFIEVGYFKQEESTSDKTALDEYWDEFPALTNAEARADLARCGLTNDHITSKMKVLSGGEHSKVRLAKIMRTNINVLVLDEPTNHLDIIAKDVLKKAVQDFAGTVIMVSHEPEFYMDIATDIWDVEKWTTKEL